MAKYEKLFDEFPPLTAKDWKEKIIQDLKGAPYDKLIWKNIEGVDVKPFYTEEDLKSLPFLNSFRDYLPGNRESGSWEIREDITVESWEKANKKGLNALNKGASSLAFIIPDNLQVSKEGIGILLKDIVFECININFISYTQSAQILDHLITLVKEKGVDATKVFGSVAFDPLGHLSLQGNLPNSPEEELKKLASLTEKASKALPGLRIGTLNGQNFHNAGSTIVQELAYSLAILSDYLEALSSSGISIETAVKSIQFNLAAGSIYFMEIAKFRAARLLFAKMVKAWDKSGKVDGKCFLHASTSTWNQTVYDPYVNMLRGTTEGMAAALGGVDSLTVTPFDHAFRKSTQFSDRIARNTQIVLKEEAYLAKVNDVPAGSYYIESLTDSIATAAWDLFVEIENQGGYLHALKKGTIQKSISETAAKRDQNVAERRRILLGTNQYPNAGESLHEDFNASIAFNEGSGKEKNQKHIVEPVKVYRGSEEFEKLRIQTEKSAQKPKVFLLTYGNPVMRKARAGFASGFFACAGYEIIDNAGFDNVPEGLKAAQNASSDIIVLCSADEEYLPMATEIKNADSSTDKNAILVVAGYPKESIEELKKLGLKHFIHMKSNVLEELKNFQKEIEKEIDK